MYAVNSVFGMRLVILTELRYNAENPELKNVCLIQNSHIFETFMGLFLIPDDEFGEMSDALNHQTDPFRPPRPEPLVVRTRELSKAVLIAQKD